MKNISDNIKQFSNTLVSYELKPLVIKDIIRDLYCNSDTGSLIYLDNRNKTVSFISIKSDFTDNINKLFEILFYLREIDKLNYINLLPFNIDDQFLIYSISTDTKKKNQMIHQYLFENDEIFIPQLNFLKNKNKNKSIYFKGDNYLLFRKYFCTPIFVTDALKSYVKNNFQTEEETIAKNTLFWTRVAALIAISIPIIQIIINLFSLIISNIAFIIACDFFRKLTSII